MSSASKEPGVSGEIGNNSPVLHPESPSNPLSARLQEEYSELLRYAVGMPGTERRTLESPDQAFKPINKSGASSTRQTPVDHQEWDSPLMGHGNDGTGNFNANSLYNIQAPRFKNVATTRALDMNVNTDTKNDDGTEVYESTSVPVSGSVPASHAIIIESSLTCLSGKLDSWLGKLKSDILAEFRHLTVQSLESQKCFHQKEIQGIRCDKQNLEREVNRLNEVVNNCEQSMSRKDTVIDNVTQALRKQRDKVTMAHAFYNAKAEYVESKREKFTESMAVKYNERRLTEKVLRAWFGLIQKNWRCRSEQVYDKKAQDVCRQLCIDYEDKIKALNGEIENMKKKLESIQNEREQYALQVKKAFMRGMCALNMETMSAFTQEETQISPVSEISATDDNSNACNINKNLQSNCPQKDDLHIKHVPADVTISTVPDLDGGHFSSLAVIGTSHPEQSKLRQSKGKARPSTAPSASSYHTTPWGISQPLAPPMASIVVERHDPVTKQTVGKATASRYPKYSTSKGKDAKQKHAVHSSLQGHIPISQMFHTFQPLAGQSPNMPAGPGIKVVE